MRWIRNLLPILAFLALGCLRGSKAEESPAAPSTTQKLAARVAAMGLNANPSPDGSAVRLEVKPLDSTGAPGSRCLVIATVTDPEGQPRRQKKIEWSLDGEGFISAVDTGSYLTVLEKKPQDKFAVSYTGSLARTIKGDGGEDVPLRAGQTWCVISSDTEGQSRLTIHAPEIADKRSREAFVLRRWADVSWTPPAPFVAKVGDQPALATTVLRVSDRMPAANYRVRYRLLDGPPALLTPNRTQEVEVAANNGTAQVVLSQPVPRAGRNRIGMELIRANPSAPETAGTVVARSETAVDWQTAQVAIAITAPPGAVAGQEFPITLTVTNSGQTPAGEFAIRLPAPEGAYFIQSSPRARDEGGQLQWSLPALPPGSTRTIQAVFKTPTPGVIQFAAALNGRDGLALQERATTRVAVAQLQADIKGPPTAAPGDAVTFDAILTNAGSGRATNVVLIAAFDDGLEHASRTHPLEVRIGALEPGQSRHVPLVLTPKKNGTFRVRLTASADGNLSGEALHNLSVAGKLMDAHVTGPASRFVDRTGVWEAAVTNPGPVPLTNVMVRLNFPPELECRGAGQKGQFTAKQVVWPVGTLLPSERKALSATAAAIKLVNGAQVTAVATADGVPEQTSIAKVEVLGIPGVRVDIASPAAAAPAKTKLVYKIVVRNTGSLAARNIAVTAELATLRPLAATGPTVGRIAGDRVGFDAIDRLDAKQTATFLIEVEALQAGDGRIRVNVTSDQSPQPIQVEESTTIVPAPPAPKTQGSVG